jgi:hypothetical protein
MAATIDLEFGGGRFNFALPVYPTIAAIQKARGYQVTFPDGSTGLRPKPFGQTVREIMMGDYDVLDMWEIGKGALQAGGGGVLSDGTRVDIKDGAHARMLWEQEAATWPIETLMAYVSNIIGQCALNYTPPEGSEPGNVTTPATGG